MTIAAVLVAGFCRRQYGSDWFEVSAFITGVIGVYLAAVEHLLLWPISIVNVLIYAWVFYTGRLYADMTLQFFYFALCIHGWWSWMHGGAKETELKISRLTPKQWGLAVVAVVVGTAIYTPLVAHYKGSAPFVDSLLTSASIVAQILLNRKVFDNWIMWILIDAAYVPLYVSRHFEATAILYFLFIVLAVVGLVNWRRLERDTDAVTAT